MNFIFRLNTVCVLLLAMASGCQSSRFSAWFPPVAVHRAAPAAAPTPGDMTAGNPEVLLSAPEQPELTAALPAEKEVVARSSIYARNLPAIKSFSKPAAQQALPDTVGTQRTTRPTPDQMRDGDSANVFAHTIGGFFLALGVILFIVALASTSPGWGPLAAAVYGTLAIIISLPFLLFRSSKSTSYVLEQEARAARKASKVRK
jgi:hypothetical protein